MRIMSLVLGGAIALAISSGARSEDAVVPDETQQIQSVNACDAYGPGFAKLPGTETCVRVSGQFRYEKTVSSAHQTSAAHDSHGRFTLDFESRSD